MQTKPQYAIIITLIIFISGIAISSATGLWTTKSAKTPVKLTVPGYAGEYDPADIRGSYTFADISGLFNIPIENLSESFGFDAANASTFKCKDLEVIYTNAEFEVGTASVKMFVAYYLGLPYAPTEETYLTDTAVKILTEKGNLTPEQKIYIDSHTVPAA